jgi:hypothetical protein
VDFIKVIHHVIRELDAQGVRYALIGGFAMALRGVQRATIDMDFILMMDDLEKADAIFANAGYKRAYRSPNVSHYISEQLALGRIDILHAFRGPTLSMLNRADRIQIEPELSLLVVQVEDIIGLKIQALCNDPSREANDWNDIRMILEACAADGRILDWELITDYLEIFSISSELKMLQKWYGKVE